MLFPRKAEVLEIHRELLEQFGGRRPAFGTKGCSIPPSSPAANRQHYEARCRPFVPPPTLST